MALWPEEGEGVEGRKRRKGKRGGKKKRCRKNMSWRRERGMGRKEG